MCSVLPHSGLTGRVACLAAAALLAACGDSPSAANEQACNGEPVRLAVGDAVDLRAGAPCDLGVQAGAEYALAFVDTRMISAARSGADPRESTDTYSVTITDLLSGGVRQAAIPSVALNAAPHWTVLPPNGPRRYEGVSGGDDGWAVGDEVTITDRCPAGTTCPAPPVRAARVVRVYPGGLVVGAVEAEVAGALPATLAVLDQAVPLVNQHALPLLKSAFTDGAAAVTSAASGQMFILLEGDNSTSTARAWSRAEAGRAVSWISVEPLGERTVSATASLLAHELTHAYQFEYLLASRGQATTVGFGPVWGVEGGANLMSYEMVRRAAARPLAGNLDFRTPGGSEMEQYYALRAQPGYGADFAAGYESAMGFLRDQVIRHVQRGDAVDQAVREVSRGAADGWYGVDRFGARRTGLTARMESRVQGWDPADALLTWALGYAGDDLTDNPAYQDRASLRVWRRGDDGYGWAPGATMDGGSGSATVQTQSGSPNYVILRDTGRGVSVQLAASVENASWRVLRIR